MTTTRHRPTRAFALRAAAITLCLAACGDGAPGNGEFEQRVLAGGATMTRNPVTGLVWQEPRLLHEELRIGAQDGTGPEVFGGVVGLDVDALGRIYVADGHSSEIRQFAPDGRHIRTFGGEGAGPGELGVTRASFWIRTVTSG